MNCHENPKDHVKRSHSSKVMPVKIDDVRGHDRHVETTNLHPPAKFSEDAERSDPAVADDWKRDGGWYEISEENVKEGGSASSENRAGDMIF